VHGRDRVSPADVEGPSGKGQASSKHVGRWTSQNCKSHEGALGEVASGEGKEGGLKLLARTDDTAYIHRPTPKSPSIQKPNKTAFDKDRRRKHHHWLAIFYADGGKFARVYLSEEKARTFADRQKRSPPVERTRVQQIA
jgi:hypothetical protein